MAANQKAIQQEVVAENEDAATGSLRWRKRRRRQAANDKRPLIAQMEVAEGSEGEGQLENKHSLTASRTCLVPVVQQLNATQEENEQLKAQIAAQDDPTCDTHGPRGQRNGRGQLWCVSEGRSRESVRK